MLSGYPCLENITDEIYYRGLDYAEEERVKIIDEKPKSLSAFVEGSKRYTVEFRQGQKYIKGYCDCPYSKSHDDYCKHIAAVAIFYDWSRKLDPPNAQKVDELTLEIDKNFHQKVKEMFDDPLNADLEFLAKASDYSPWGVKPHAKIPVHSVISDSPKNLTTVELIKGLKEISRIISRSTFDHYFCAGEISAVFAKTLDTVVVRLKHTQVNIALKIFELCVVYYYQYLESIDGSDGVWEIPQARLPVIYQIVKDKGVSAEQFAKARENLNFLIKGWGDIFEDIGIG